MNCHTDIADQLNTKTGLHAALDSPLQYAACHSDHRGRGFDMLRGALDKFDHTISGFGLIWHQIDFDSSPNDSVSDHVSNSAGPSGEDDHSGEDGGDHGNGGEEKDSYLGFGIQVANEAGRI